MHNLYLVEYLSFVLLRSGIIAKCVVENETAPQHLHHPILNPSLEEP